MKEKLHYFKLLLLLFGIIPCANAQWQNGLWIEKQAYNWCFGDHDGLEFSTGEPLPLSGVQLSTTEGSTVISDSNGQLLFYSSSSDPSTAGDIKVFNKNHQVMSNGSGLVGNSSSTQFGVVVPKPGDPDIYYLFLVSRRTGFQYSEIDMTLDGGNGDVTENKNIMLQANAKIEKITAVHHANGKDVWVITHLTGSDEFVAYLITEEGGVSAEPVISAVGFPYIDLIFLDAVDYAVGEFKASPDGKKLAAGYFGYFGTNRGIEVLDFNNETGEISNPKFLDGDFSNILYGIEFSPNSRFIYGAEYDNPFDIDLKIIQFDLDAGDQAAINNSGTVISSINGIDDTGGGMQVGPDGKIYFKRTTGENYVQSINVIDFPNNEGIAAISPNTVVFIENAYTYGLPTFIQSYFASGILYEGSKCFGEEITFSTLRIPDITSILWDFGDPNSGAANISNEPHHVFSGPGTYTVTAAITSNGAVQTATTEIVIIDRPTAMAPAAELLTKCADENGNAVFDLAGFNATILDGQDINIFSLAYFATEADRLANAPISNISNFTTTGQTIYAVVTNSQTGCTILPFFAFFSRASA